MNFHEPARWRAPTRRREPALAAATVAVALLLTLTSASSTPAHAAGVYFTRASVLRAFFTDCDRVSYLELTPTPSQQRRLRQRLGVSITRDQVIYYGVKDGALRGYALLGDTPGQHEDISFAVLVAPDGHLARLEVMVYREPKGGEVRRAQFRDQFVGATAAQPLVSGRDIVAISGATISSRSLSRGVKRALVLLDELVLRAHLSPTVGSR